jgi:hypothetical protein
LNVLANQVGPHTAQIVLEKFPQPAHARRRRAAPQRQSLESALVRRRHGNWFKSGHGLVSVAWVHVRDLNRAHREEYFFTTNVTLSAKAIVEMYGARWNIETTFQEMRCHLGLETTRGWSRQTVLRMAPCPFVLYAIVVVFYDAPSAQRNATPLIEPLIQWSGKHMKR